MRTFEEALAPGGEEPSVAVEHDDRVLAPIEDVHPVARIGRHAGNFDEGPSWGKLLPALERLVLKLAGANHGMPLEQRVLSTQYSVLSTQYSVLSTQYSVLGTRYSV